MSEYSLIVATLVICTAICYVYMSKIDDLKPVINEP